MARSTARTRSASTSEFSGTGSGVTRGNSGQRHTGEVSGTAVAMTAEACSLVSGTTYQVTNAAKRIIDPATAVTVKDAGTPIAAANVTIDYLFGLFTPGQRPGWRVTVDASYLPTTTIAEAKSVDLNVAVDLVDSTSFDSSRVEAQDCGSARHLRQPDALGAAARRPRWRCRWHAEHRQLAEGRYAAPHRRALHHGRPASRVGALQVVLR